MTMKTKPFILSEALAGARVVTRDGREVTQLHSFSNARYQIAGVLNSDIYTFNKDGSYLTGQENDCDLFLLDEPKKITLYGYAALRDGEIVASEAHKEESVRNEGVKFWQEKNYSVVTFEHEVVVPGERE